MRNCNAILGTAIAAAVIGGLGGLALAHGRPLAMLVHAALGVWGGALVGALVGALGCVLLPARPRAAAPPSPRSARSLGSAV